MNQYTTLTLIHPGSIDISRILFQNLKTSTTGSALLVDSLRISLFVELSIFKNCSSIIQSYGGSICIINANQINIKHSYFHKNYCIGCPDIVVLLDGSNVINNCSMKMTSFVSSESQYCSNWFRAITLSLDSLNASMMVSGTRASGLCTGSKESSSVPVVNYCYIGNCTGYSVVEIDSLAYASLQFHYFIVTDCQSSNVIFSKNRDSAYKLTVINSVFLRVLCITNLWIERDLDLSFMNTVFSVCPSLGAIVSSGNAFDWTHVWPRFSLIDRKCSQSPYTLKIGSSLFTLSVFFMD